MICFVSKIWLKVYEDPILLAQPTVQLNLFSFPTGGWQAWYHKGMVALENFSSPKNDVLERTTWNPQQSVLKGCLAKQPLFN